MVIGHGIHNVASFLAKSGFRFASLGRSTRLFSLPLGLETQLSITEDTTKRLDLTACRGCALSL
jgi:hypothetical protein